MDAPATSSPGLAERKAGNAWWFGGAALLLFVLLFGRSMMRNFDVDEHQFVAPAVFLTSRGLLPYRDYPYFHMPDLIYLHAAVTAWIPYKLLAARAFSVLCGWGTVLLLARAGWQALAGQSRRSRWLLVGGVLSAYLCSQLFVYTNGWAWNHDSATLCAVGAYLALVNGLRRGRVGPIGLAGVLAGLAVGIRLSFALIFVPLGLGVWLGRAPLSWRARGLAFAFAVAGACLALTPAFIPWFQDPQAFVFGNLGYAALSTRFYALTDSNMSLPGKVVYLFRKFLSDPGNAFLFLAGAYALGYVFWKKRAWRSRFANEMGLLLGLLPVLAFGAMGPNPIQQQYFYMLLPFLTLAGFYAMALECSQSRGLVRWQRLVAWCALLPAVVGLPRWYWQVEYLPFVSDWVPIQVHRTGEWIKDHCPTNARVMTADPVFPLEAGLGAYPEYAVGRFVFHVGSLMNQEDRRRFHMAWGEELDTVMAQSPPDAIFRHTRVPIAALAQYAQEHRYRRLEHRLTTRDPFSEEDQFELWVRDPAVASNKQERPRE
jgi:hypothetical protein